MNTQTARKYLADNYKLSAIKNNVAEDYYYCCEETKLQGDYYLEVLLKRGDVVIVITNYIDNTIGTYPMGKNDFLSLTRKSFKEIINAIIYYNMTEMYD